MRKSMVLAVILAAGFAAPAQAVGLGDLAKVVLGNGAVLKKGNDTCPATSGTSTSGTTTLGQAILGQAITGQTGTSQTATGTSSLLGADELLALAFAREAAQKALPQAQFLSLDTAANATAAKSAQSPTFCTNTAKKKNVLMDAVKKAGQKLITARVLGL
jgi:hypothetical protein